MKRQFVCIVCPVGCLIDVIIEGEEITNITGNGCKRGIDYVKKESTHPTRTLTTTIAVQNGEKPLVPVKSAGELPKELLFACMKLLKAIKIEAPMDIGQIIFENILDTGIDIIACKSVKSAKKVD